jgi:hypothetical protein
VCSTDPKVARKQDRMNRINRFVVRCDCNRPTLDTQMAPVEKEPAEK